MHGVVHGVVPGMAHGCIVVVMMWVGVGKVCIQVSILKNIDE